MLSTKLKKSVVAMSAFLLSTAASATVDQTGTIAAIIVEGNNVVSIWLNGTYPGTECNGGRWTMQNTDPLFNQKLAQLTAAALASKTVLLRSTGTCGPWSSNSVYLVWVTY